MRDLLTLKGEGLSLILTGEYPPLPPHVGALPNARSELRAFLRPLAVRFDGSADNVPIGLTLRRITHYPILFENETYDVYISSPQSVSVQCDAGVFLHVRDNYVEGGITLHHYRLSLGSDVGLLEFQLRSGSQPVCDIKLEVFPRKLSYHDDLAEMIADISAISHSVVFDLVARTSLASSPHRASKPSDAEWLAVARTVFSRLVATVDLIATAPHRAYTAEYQRERLDRAKRIRATDFIRAIRAPKGETVLTPLGVRLPLRVPQKTHSASFNTPPNHFLRWLLRELEARARMAENSFRDDAADTESAPPTWRRVREQWTVFLREVQREVSRCEDYDFIARADARMPDQYSSVLEWDPLYSRAYQLGLTLLRGMRADLVGDFGIGAKTIWLLYEYWCFVAIVQLLQEQHTLTQLTAIRVDQRGSRVVIAKGEQAAAEFVRKDTGARLRIVYNRMFPTPTIAQRPDAIVQIETRDAVHVFDAKYRLAFDDDYVRQYGGIGPMTDDINTMHRYRDAIVNQSLSRMVDSACVLFPGMEEGYQRHRFYQSLETVGVGGLPFLPSSKTLVRRHLSQVVGL